MGKKLYRLKYMVDAKDFINHLLKKNINFFTGVPDSILKNFITCLSFNKKKILFIELQLVKEVPYL